MAIETVISSLLLFIIAMVALGGDRRAYLQIMIAIFSFIMLVYIKTYSPINFAINHYLGLAIIVLCFSIISIKTAVAMRRHLRSNSNRA